MKSLTDVYLESIRVSLELELEWVNVKIKAFDKDDPYNRGYITGLIEEKKFLESMLFRNNSLKIS